MSSLIFYTEESLVLVATDTLATSPDGRPFKYTTKAFILPHLRMIIAGTGVGGFLGRWFIEINDRMVVGGVDHLDYHTPSNLAAMWQGYKQEFSFTDSMTTTVYHFGFSEVTGVIHSYAYRSANGFQSERLEQYGLRVKPECPAPENFQFPKDIRKMMGDQRAIQAAKPKEQRIYIGGDIQIHHLGHDGFYAYTLDRFEDYDRDEKAMYENFRDAKNP
jgi:hypothetical protein